MVFERPLCALHGFTLHAATRRARRGGRGGTAEVHSAPRSRAGASHTRPDKLVRIALKKPFSDRTVAVDLDPLSLLSRLPASVPAPRLSSFGHHEARHTVRYGGCSRRRVRSGPVSRRSLVVASENALDMPESPRRGCYRPWAELLKRAFGQIQVLRDLRGCPGSFRGQPDRIRLRAFLKTKHPELVPVWDGILNGYIAASPCPKYSNVSEFDERYLGVSDQEDQAAGLGNFLWYQGVFHRAAKAVYAARGLNFVDDMKTLVKKLAKVGPEWRVPAATAVDAIAEISPALKGWSEAIKATAVCH
jgi:hypothetical protein